MKQIRTAVLRGTSALVIGAAMLVPLTGAHAGDAIEVTGPNIVTNGGFERGADPGARLPLPAGAPLLDGWTTSGTELSLCGTFWQAEEGTRSLSMTNPGTTPATGSSVKQVLATKVGQKYRVVFYQAGNPNDHMPSTVRLQIGGWSHDYTYQSDGKASYKNMEWVQRSFVYAATAASTPISFTAIYTPGNDSFGLDNVQVRAIQPTGATPPPSPNPAASIALSAKSVSAGGKEILGVAAAPNASLVVVIDFANGTQLVTQGRTDAAGKYATSIAIPTGTKGSAHIVVDAAGFVAQSSFTIS